MAIPNEKLLAMYRDLLTGRLVGNKIWELISSGQTTSYGNTGTHRGTGEEAIPIGALHALKKGDFFRPTFRTHYCFFAQQDGAYPIKDILAQELGRDVIKAGGHSYFIAPDVGNSGHRVSLGPDVPVSVGVAMAAKIRKTGQIVMCNFGDGQASRGHVHEAMIVAVCKQLPVVFGLQNNKYASATPYRTVYTNLENLSDRAKGYGMPGVTIDGNDITAVYETVTEYAERARSGAGPGLIVFDTYRLYGHMGIDPGKYRPKGEAEEWWKFDPLPRFQKKLMEMGLLTEADANHLEEEVKADIEKATEEALKYPVRTKEDVLKMAIDAV